MLFGYSFAKVQKKRIITIFLIFATLTKKACFIYKIPTVAHRYEVPDHPAASQRLIYHKVRKSHLLLPNVLL